MSENETPTLPPPSDANPSGDRPAEQPDVAPEQPADSAGAPKRGRGRPRTVTFGKVCRLVTKLDAIAGEDCPIGHNEAFAPALAFADIRVDEFDVDMHGRISAGDYLLVPFALGKPEARYSILHRALANALGVHFGA